MNEYMSSPDAKTVIGFKRALDILAKYLLNGERAKFFASAEHDIFCVNVNGEVLSEDSEDGLELSRLGWHYDSEYESWAYYT